MQLIPIKYYKRLVNYIFLYLVYSVTTLKYVYAKLEKNVQNSFWKKAL